MCSNIFEIADNILTGRYLFLEIYTSFLKPRSKFSSFKQFGNFSLFRDSLLLVVVVVSFHYYYDNFFVTFYFVQDVFNLF